MSSLTSYPSPETELVVPDKLAPIELYTVWGRESAWISAGGRRTSDWLNRGDTIVLHGVRPLHIDGEDELPSLPADPTNLERVDRLAADVLFVVPPPAPPNRHLQLHRRIEELRLELASFALVGNVHIRAGTRAGDYLLRGNRRFVPITDVELTYTGDVPFVRQLPVVIVNVTHVTLLDRSHPHAASRTETVETVREALEQLTALARDGLITDEELARKRAEVLARI